MSAFGERLRSMRVRQGLSQAELGGERFSASYISHLERGMRHPSSGALEFLAHQLSVDVEDLLSRADEMPSADQIAYALRQAQLQAALLRRDFEEVQAYSEEISTRDGSLGQWWSARRVLAESLLAQGSYDQCVEVTDKILASGFTESSATLKAIILVTRSRALRARGDLVEAQVAGESAVRCVSAAECAPDDVKVAALNVEIAANAELGNHEAMSQGAESLRSLKATLGPGHIRGIAAWTLGNVEFGRGQVLRGITEHDEASMLLRPEADLRAWARFNKATATMRITAGVFDGLDQFIENATHGLSIVGNAGDRAELDLLHAERLLIDDPQAALRRLSSVVADHELPPQTRADVELARARAFERLLRHHEQFQSLVRAAECLTEAGAAGRATDVWRKIADLGRPRSFVATGEAV